MIDNRQKVTRLGNLDLFYGLVQKKVTTTKIDIWLTPNMYPYTLQPQPSIDKKEGAWKLQIKTILTHFDDMRTTEYQLTCQASFIANMIFVCNVCYCLQHAESRCCLETRSMVFWS